MHGITEYDLGFLATDAWHNHPRYLVMDRDVTDDEALSVYNAHTFTKEPSGHLFNGEFVSNERFDIVNQATGLATYVGASNSYEAIPYVQFFEPFIELLGSFGFTIKSAGTINAGARAFLSVQVSGNSFEIGGYSKVETVFNIAQGTDGKLSMMGAWSANIIVCSNTMRTNLLGVPKAFKVKSTTNGAQAVARARQELEASLTVKSGVQDAMERLVNVAFTEGEFRKMTAHLVSDGKGRPESESRAQTMFDNQFEAIMTRYNESDIDGIRPTVLGALQATQGFGQWSQRLHKGTDRTARAIDMSIMDGSNKIAEAAAAYLKVDSLVKA